MVTLGDCPRFVNGSEIKVGDLLVFLGFRHLVRSIDPYPPDPGCDLDKTGWLIAHCESDWTITLIPQLPYEVERA